MRPSVELHLLLSGKQAWGDTSAPVRSWAQFEIWKAARQVAAKPDQEARRAALSRIPPDVRPQVEQEARRIYESK